jgi:hypothetical protein
MTIMRAISALSLILLSACAAGIQHGDEPISNPAPQILQISTAQPVQWAAAHKQGEKIVEIRVDACQTNDPMPVARLGQPVPPMPRSSPLRVAPIPNACPVTVPWTSTTVFTSAPVPQKTVPAPAPTKPQP